MVACDREAALSTLTDIYAATPRIVGGLIEAVGLAAIIW